MHTYAKSVKLGAATPREATSLETITHFFQYMQVKYGGRWLSILGEVPYMGLLIKDPVKTAKALWGISSSLIFRNGIDFLHLHCIKLAAQVMDRLNFYWIIW